MKQRKKGGTSWEITEPRERYSALPEKVLSTSFKRAPQKVSCTTSKSVQHFLVEELRNHVKSWALLLSIFGRKKCSALLSTSFFFYWSFMHYLKKCSELLSSRNKKLYKGLSTFTFNISEWKSAQHYLKKCSALLSRRNKNTYKGLSTFTFNILDWKSAQPF